MIHRGREERRRKRWLAVLHDAREEGARTRAVTERLAGRGLLEPDEGETLRHVALREDITRSAAKGIELSIRDQIMALAAVIIADSPLAWWMVGGSRGVVVTVAVACGVQAVAAAILWTLDLAAFRLTGPVVSVPALLEGGEYWRLPAAVGRYLVLARLVAAGLIAASPIALGAVVASSWRGVAAAAVVATLFTYILWLTGAAVIRVVSREVRWRHLVPRDRALPAALVLAVDLMWCLARVDRAASTRHGAPLWITAYFRVFADYNGRSFFVAQWITGASHGWRRRQELVRIERSYTGLLQRYADRFEQAVSPDQHGAAVLGIRDHLRCALSGDLSFLDLETTPPWWRRTLPRILSAVALGAAAIALPYLPGVTASATTLAGIQVGLAVTAVLTLVGTPAEAQKSVAEAMKSASAGK